MGRFSIGTGPWLLAWLNWETCELNAVSFGELDRRIDMNRPYALPYTVSADGRWIYFALHADKPGDQTGNNGPQAELYRAPVEGGTPKRLLEFPARIYGLHPDGGADGLYAVTDLGTSHNDIWHVPFVQPLRDARKLTYLQADEDSPSIAATGRWLVFTENSHGTTRLVRRRVETGEWETIRLTRIKYGRPTGTIRLRMPPGDEMAARISVKEKDGKFFAPAGALYRTTAGLGYVYARGGAQLELPIGAYEIRAFRGPEYRMIQHEFEVRAGAAVEVEIELKRWTNAPARGWYSGENHIHANYGYGAWYNLGRYPSTGLSSHSTRSGSHANRCHREFRRRHGNRLALRTG